MTTFEPNVRFSSFGDVGLRGTVQLRPGRMPDQALVKHVFITRLHAAFKAQGIEIPTIIPPKSQTHLARRPSMRQITIALVLTGALSWAVSSSAQEPPATPPADWGPMSINLEDVPYPHPVAYHSFNLEGQDVRMAYMDVAPQGPANGKSVVLLHGMNFFGEAWAGTIEILRREGYRVIVPDQIGYGRSSKPILHYSISTHAANTKRLLDHLRITTTDMVTHSMGGMVASRFAASYPGDGRVTWR